MLRCSGRENFLAAEADRALAEMCRRASEHRVVAVLCANANHKSTHVRAKVGGCSVCVQLQLVPVVWQAGHLQLGIVVRRIGQTCT
jgi:hypothetical protein